MAHFISSNLQIFEVAKVGFFYTQHQVKLYQIQQNHFFSSDFDTANLDDFSQLA